MDGLRADTFFCDNERLPHFGKDPAPPWRYWGWLCMMIKLMHMDPGYYRIENRWGYLIETRRRGHLLEHPIPTLDFQYNAEGMKHLEALVHVMEGPYRTWESFSMLVDWLAWGCGASAYYPERVTDEMAEALYRLLKVEIWLSYPFDYLGHMIEVVTGSGWNPSGFYPTPFDVVDILLRAQVGPDPGDLRDKTFYDCSVGTGRTLLEASNYSLRLYGQDIDGFVIKICLINGCFYAPWMIDPLPDRFWQHHEQSRALHDGFQRFVDLDRQHHARVAKPVVIEVAPAPEPGQLILPIGGRLPSAPTHQVSSQRRSRSNAGQDAQEPLFPRGGRR